MTITKVFSLVTLLAVSLTAILVAADFSASTGGSAPPDGLPAGMADMIAAQAVSAKGPDGKIAVEFWPRTAAFDGDPVSGFGIRFESMPEGAFLAVVRFPESGSDFREQGVKPGVYTMRYGLHPEDGNHMGVATSRDFALLSRVDADTEPAKDLAFEQLTQLSISSSGNPHPTILRLELPDSSESGNIWQGDMEHWVLDLAIPGDVIGVVVYGHSEE